MPYTIDRLEDWDFVDASTQPGRDYEIDGFLARMWREIVELNDLRVAQVTAMVEEGSLTLTDDGMHAFASDPNDDVVTCLRLKGESYSRWRNADRPLRLLYLALSREYERHGRIRTTMVDPSWVDAHRI